MPCRPKPSVTAGLRWAPLSRPSGLRATATIAPAVTIATKAMRPAGVVMRSATGLSACQATTRPVTSTKMTVAAPTSSATGAASRQRSESVTVSRVGGGTPRPARPRPPGRAAGHRPRRGARAPRSSAGTGRSRRRTPGSPRGARATADSSAAVRRPSSRSVMRSTSSRQARSSTFTARGPPRGPARTALRPRCRSTRSLPSVRSSASCTSDAVQPSTSRSSTTERWRGGSASIAACATVSVSRPVNRSSGRVDQSIGAVVQCPGHRSSGPRNRSPGHPPGSCSGPAESSGTGCNRASRAPRRRAWLITMPMSQLRRLLAPLEAVQAPDGGQPRLLHDIGRRGVVVDVRPRHPEQGGVLPGHHPPERQLVARPERLDLRVDPLGHRCAS